ncbi:replication protein [Priestia megaterium]|uniref:replication protein n=1 Tax=Priestia megaterium TaxID=1404 RepID=UPI00316CD84C
MKKAGIENRYTKIANRILEEIAKIKLSPTQYRLLFVIWRYTYGFHRTKHLISLSFLHQATGCDLRQIQRELKKLELRKLISQKIEQGKCREISFNKNYEEWVGRITVGENDSNTQGENIKETNGQFTREEINKKKLKEIHDQSIPHSMYRNLFGPISAALNDNLNYWIEQSEFQEPEKIICETIRRAKLQAPDKPELYINSILKNLNKLGLRTFSEVEEHNRKFDMKKNRRKSKGTTPALTDMFDPSQSDYKQIDKKELKEIKEMEEKFPF